MATPFKKTSSSKTRSTTKATSSKKPSSSSSAAKKNRTTRKKAASFARLGKTTRLVSNLNWENTTQKLVKAKNLNQLRKELARVANELQKLEVRIEMSPAVYEKWQQLSATYQDVLNHLHRLQNELDREVHAAAAFLEKTKDKWAAQLAKVTTSANWKAKDRPRRTQRKPNK